MKESVDVVFGKLSIPRPSLRNVNFNATFGGVWNATNRFQPRARAGSACHANFPNCSRRRRMLVDLSSPLADHLGHTLQ
jgi:hypothetical protein